MDCQFISLGYTLQFSLACLDFSCLHAWKNIITFFILLFEETLNQILLLGKKKKKWQGSKLQFILECMFLHYVYCIQCIFFNWFLTRLYLFLCNTPYKCIACRVYWNIMPWIPMTCLLLTMNFYYVPSQEGSF